MAALGVAGGTSYADPAAAPIAYRNVDQGVAYEVSQTERDGAEVVSARLDGGTFTLTADSVVVTDRAGKQIADLPLTVEFDGGEMALQPQISADGTQLTAQPIGHWRTTSPKDRSTEAGASIGAVAGGALGASIPNSDVPDQREYVPTCIEGYRHTYCY